MRKIKEAKMLLKKFGLPTMQQNDRSALVLLALCNLKPKDDWKDAKQISMSVVGNRENAKYEGIMRFIAQHYKKLYAENSRETLRRQTLHQFVQANMVDHNPEDLSIPTNSKDNHYRISSAALQVIRAYKTSLFESELTSFIESFGTLQLKYARDRKHTLIPLTLPNGKEFLFSPGKHNRVQAAIIKEFASRFAKGSEVLYIGDTAKKDLYLDEESLRRLEIPIGQHTKLPDIVIYDKNRNWIFLIEAVTSHGPVSPKRMMEMEEMLINCKAAKIYVTAFPDRAEFKKHIADIAWETEVWIADDPNHMIHFNGNKFLGPR